MSISLSLYIYIERERYRRFEAELNREIKLCRACPREVCMSSEFGAKIYGRGLSLFPFGLRRFSLFPWSMAARRRDKREEKREDRKEREEREEKREEKRREQFTERKRE